MPKVKGMLWDEENEKHSRIVKIGPPSLDKIEPNSKQGRARAIHTANKKAKPKKAFPGWLPGAIMQDRGLRYS